MTEELKTDIANLSVKKFAYKYRGKKFIAITNAFCNNTTTMQIIGYRMPSLLCIRLDKKGWKSLGKADKILIPIKNTSYWYINSNWIVDEV